MANLTHLDWECGIDAEETGRVLASAIAQGETDSRPSLMFHNLDLFSQRINHLYRCFPPQTLHTLAIKANPVLTLLRFAVECGMGLEAASIEEVALARAAGCLPSRIVYDSPAKTREEIAKALNWGVSLNADNFQELVRINDFLGSDPCPKSLIGLRVNPQIGFGNIGILSVSGQYSKFGVPLNEKRENIVSAFVRYPWLSALHVHVGSQGIQVEQMIHAVALIFKLREEIHSKLGELRIESVDIGGGLPWRYQLHESIVTPESYSTKLARMVPDSLKDNVRLVTEFGRGIQAGCGFAASKVEYLKTDGGKRTAVIHFGADLFMRRVYHPQDWHHNITVLASDATLKVGNEELHTIVGPLCFAGDILADNIKLPRIEEGDWIILHDTGAYTLSLWSRHCNRVLPLVLGYSANPFQFRVLFQGENTDDIVRFWSLSG